MPNRRHNDRQKGDVMRKNGECIKETKGQGIVREYSEIFSALHEREWNVKDLFIRAARKHAPHMRKGNIMNDVEIFRYADAGVIPKYVRKYMDVLRRVRERTIRREVAKKLPPPYRRPSPAQVRW